MHAHHSYMANRRLSVASITLLALMPLSLIVTNGVAKSLAPAILFLTGIYLLSTSRDARKTLQIGWLLLGAACLMFLYLVINVILHGFNISALGGAAHILLYLVIAVVFTLRFDTRILWIGFSLTAIALGILCIVQHFGWHDPRAHAPGRGTYTAIEYAMVLFGLALVSVIQLLHMPASLGEKIIHGTGFILGAYGALLTQSRGPILAFSTVFVAILAFHVVRKWRWRRSIPWLVAGILLAVLAAGSIRGVLVQRFKMIVPQVMAYESGKVDTSIGLRLEMWRTAFRGFVSHPWTGVGVGNFKAYKADEIKAGRTKAATAQFATPHNTYLKAAVEGGIPGVLVLLVLFGTALGFFTHHANDPDPEISAPAITGLAITVLYMLCGLTDSVFFFVMSLSFYFLVALGTAVLIASRIAQHGSVAADGTA